MNYRACVKIPLDINGIYYRIYTKILKIIIIIVHLEALENGRIQILEQSIKRGDTSLNNAAMKALKINSCVM